MVSNLPIQDEDVQTLHLSYYFFLKITKGRPYNIRCIYLGEYLGEPDVDEVVSYKYLDMYM